MRYGLREHVLAVIPARGGSTRIPDKNLRSIGGQPILHLAIRHAWDAGVGKVVVSTDDSRIADLATNIPDIPVSIIWRPTEISGANADIVDAVAHAVRETLDPGRYSLVATLQPTLPFRPRRLLDGMIDLLDAEPILASALTVLPVVPWVWSLDDVSDRDVRSWRGERYPRSQDIRRRLLAEYNTVTVNRVDVALARRRHELPIALCHLPPWAAVDIDDDDDLALANRMAIAPMVFGDWEPEYAYVDAVDHDGAWDVVADTRAKEAHA